MLQVVTSMLSGNLLFVYVSGVPQVAQNPRRTGGVELNSLSWPFVSSKSAFANVSHATTGEPAARRHVWQWQTIVFVGLPVTR